MDKKKLEQVDELLNSLARDNELCLLHAVESGSRAWGFESVDSDYDIRFIYVRPKDWYLSVYEKEDVIQPVFLDDLDATGWDITKCLKLMAKGNATVYEWLNSPFVYRSDDRRLALLKSLSEEAFNPMPVFHHYCSLARRKMHEKGIGTNPKSFLYALRAVFSARWIALNGEPPPIAFERLLDELVSSSSLRDRIAILLNEKEKLREKDHFAVDKELLAFAERELDWLGTCEVKPSNKLSMERYNEVFRGLLVEE